MDIVQVLYLHQVQQNYHLSVYSAVGCHLPFTVVEHRTATNYKGHIILACLNTAEPCLCLRGSDNHSSLQHRILKSRCGVCPVFLSIVYCTLIFLKIQISYFDLKNITFRTSSYISFYLTTFVTRFSCTKHDKARPKIEF